MKAEEGSRRLKQNQEGTRLKEGLIRLFNMVHTDLKRLNKDFQEGSRKYNKFEEEPKGYSIQILI